MNSFPVSCHNCCSHKRQFYSFLECKHFMCLSCCLCLADFQNLSVRCCYRNTKMSEELAAVMFEQVNKRKSLKQSQAINDQLIKKNLMQVEVKKKFQSTSSGLEEQKFSVSSSHSDNGQSARQMDESKIVNNFKMIGQKINEDTITQRERIIASKYENSDKKQNQNPCLSLKNSSLSLKSFQRQFGPSVHIEYPTFKQIHMKKCQVQKKSDSQTQQKKQNYICWKNFNNTKDKILAKLNYQQQKMNLIMKQHY